MDDYTRDRRNSVRFADQAAPNDFSSQALEFQQLAVQHPQNPNLQPPVLSNPLQVSHQGYYHQGPAPSMTASQLGNPPAQPAYASNASANNNGASMPPPAAGSPPQVLSPSQLSSFALQIAQQSAAPPALAPQQFVYQPQSSTQQAGQLLSPTLTSQPQVMFNYSGAAQQPQHVVNGHHHGWQQQQQQQQQQQHQQTSSPIFVKNNDQSSKFAPLSITNTDDPKWHKWVELINQYWNEMAALDEQSRFQMICNLSILAAEKE